MEFVEGVPIDRYCEMEGLGIGARCELVAKVCDAVSYAHRRPQAVGAGKAAPPAPKTELVGIDIYLEWPSRDPNQLADTMNRIDVDGLKLSTIANRGLKVWPEGLPETFCTDSFRCRYTAAQPGAPVTSRHILGLLERVAAAGIDVVKTESLRNFDGKLGYTLSQGE
jgi:isocitrate dehydrogenase